MKWLALALPLLAGVTGATGAPSEATRCSARSGPAMTPVVELYTSEGCSSCPPADRWLGTLTPRRDVVALAFHVDYWDRLGWKDRFADAAYTERQYRQRRSSGTSLVYTPQVLLDGRDWRGWRQGRITAGPPAAVELQLQRDGATVQARVIPQAGAHGRYGAYWAAVEDGHVSTVRAGENARATLRHDHVVRDYRALAPWPAAEPRTLRFDSPVAGEDGRPRRVVFVVEDADTGRPLQALALRC